MQALLALYVDVVRPLVAPKGENKDTAMLFLNLDGTPDRLLGRHVERYFRTALNLKITTTTIRKMAETTAADLFRRGLLTQAQKEACHFVIGHSQTTSENFYVQ